ncbi:MAG: YciI family protein [Saprospiraceae bacterium]
MFVIELTYKVGLDKVDEYLEEHVVYLKKQYANNVFIASGKKVPRTGGVIFSKLKNKKDLLRILDEDPFKVNNLADYRIIEFIPSMTSKEFEMLKE